MEILKPNFKKFIFLIEWLIFIFILFFQGKIGSLQTWGIALYPFLFFYLIGGLLLYRSKKNKNLLDMQSLLLTAFGLFLIDQLIKLLVVIFIPLNSSIPIISGWFEITHRPNPHGAWIFTNLSDNSIPLITPFLKIFFLGLTLLCIPVYQYLETSMGKKYWIQVGFVCIFSAFLSWLVDMLTKGYIVDFIGLPGLVAADLKDIFAYIGAASIFMQALEDPVNYLKWKGWQTEIHEIKDFLSSVKHFIIEDIKMIFDVVKRLFRK